MGAGVAIGVGLGVGDGLGVGVEVGYWPGVHLSAGASVASRGISGKRGIALSCPRQRLIHAWSAAIHDLCADSQSPRFRKTRPDPSSKGEPEDEVVGAGEGEAPGPAPRISPQPGCQSLPLRSSIPARICVVSVSVGTSSALKTSVMVWVVCGPGSIPLIASIFFSTMPSGRTKSRTGSLLCAATSAM